MEKALLKVTRFNNSDVIATSGTSESGSGTDLCNHTRHYKLKNLYTGEIPSWGAVRYEYDSANGWSSELSNSNIGVHNVPGGKEGMIYGYNESTHAYEVCSNDKPHS